jgi:hypothetical protein
MRQKRATVFLLVMVAGAVLVPAVSSAQTDYILQAGKLHVPAHASRYSEGWWGASGDSTAILRWCMPPVVNAGQTVKVLVHWKYWTNHVPVFYMNYFGDWQPNTELARSRMYGGIPQPNQEFIDTFAFRAPATPGWYRIRFMQRGWYDPVTSFYGTQGALPNCYTEMLLHVGYPISGVADGPGSPRPPTAHARSIPNPFRRATKLSFVLPQGGSPCVKIFDVAGNLARTFSLSEQPAGPATLTWNGTSDSGARLPAGSYFYRVEVNDHVFEGKVTLTD